MEKTGHNQSEEKDQNIAHLSGLCCLPSDKNVLMVLRHPSYYHFKKTNAGTDEQSVTMKRATRHNCLVTPQITVISSWREEIASGCVGHNRSLAVELCLRKHTDINMLRFSEKQHALFNRHKYLWRHNIYNFIIAYYLRQYYLRQFGDILVFICFRTCIDQSHFNVFWLQKMWKSLSEMQS